jgi:hypothetical protein
MTKQFIIYHRKKENNERLTALALPPTCIALNIKETNMFFDIRISNSYTEVVTIPSWCRD